MRLSLLLIFIVAIYHWPLSVLKIGWPDQESYWAAIWGGKWFFMMAILTAFVTGKFWKKFHWSLCLTVLYFLLLALWVFGWRNSYTQPSDAVLYEIRYSSAYAFIALLILSLTMAKIKEDSYAWLELLIAALCLSNSLTIIGQFIFGVHNGVRGGLFGNPSISGCFVAFTYPFLAFNEISTSRPIWDFEVGDIIYFAIPVLLPIVAVCLAGTSQPIAIMALMFMVYTFYKARIELWKKMLWMASIILIVITTITLTTSKHGRSPFDDSGRVAVWKMVLEPWWKSGRIIQGQGTGVTAAIVPKMQAFAEAKLHKPGERFTVDEYRWMHSDWIQILFEGGIIGLVLSLVTATFALMKAYKRSVHLFASLIGFMAAMCANFPMHMPCHSFVGASLLAMSLRKEARQ